MKNCEGEVTGDPIFNTMVLAEIFNVTIEFGFLFAQQNDKVEIKDRNLWVTRRHRNMSLLFIL